MIFPIPKYAKYEKETYEMKAAYDTSSLYAFWQNVRSGSDDVTFNADAAFTGDAYRLLITAQGITITAGDEVGRFRGVTSLYRLMKTEKAIPCADVSDSPDIAHRGYMLDISRGRMPKVETIKALIDLLAELKYNELQLYMESFCFEYKHFPQVTEGFDCLTPADIIEIKQYAAARFITLVPNQNTLGHMYTWLAREEFRHLGVGDENTQMSVLNPLLPESMEFVDKLLDSLLPLFDADTVNIGSDEPFGLGQYQTAGHNAKKLYLDHLKNVCDLVKEKYGMTPMYWADMPDHHNIPGNELPKDAIALEWGYDLIQSQKMAENCARFQREGVRYYVCPACNVHCSLTGRTDVMTFNIRTAGEIGTKYGAEGFLLTDWGDSGHPQFAVWSYVPIALGGQYSWNSAGPQGGWDFKAGIIIAAWDFVDGRFFEGNKVAKTLSLLGNYYLLETERIHNGTLTNLPFYRALDTSVSPLERYEDAFANENVIRYVRHYLDEVMAKPIDEITKRMIAVNCRMVILAAEYGTIRIEQRADRAKKAALIEEIGWIRKEFGELWRMVNYEKGVEQIDGILERKIGQLEAMAE